MASALESESPTTSTLLFRPLPPLMMKMTKYVRMRRNFEVIVIHKSYGASYVVRKDLDLQWCTYIRSQV